MFCKAFTISLLLGLSLSLSACLTSGQIDYQPFEASPNSEKNMNPIEEVVWYEVKDGYYRLAPNCVVILPIYLSERDAHNNQAVEESLARNISVNFSKIIQTTELRRIAKANGYDLQNPSHVQSIAKLSQCQTILNAQAWGGEDIDIGFWTQKRVGLELNLQDDKGNILWQARHVATRSDGAMPISPLGAIAGLAIAANFRNNQEAEYSLIDDAIRRMVKTLPNLRF